tara:strand:+ start:11221 stop:11322 length:102 start_codon:yes stop_codon:yes gene_type:complete
MEYKIILSSVELVVIFKSCETQKLIDVTKNNAT